MISLTELLIESISKTKIFEMAFSREKYLNRIESLFPQILENWCLIKYCNMYDEENYNRLHWSNELLAHAKVIINAFTKFNKQRAIKQVGIELMEFDNYKVVMRYLEGKWDDEKLPTEYIEEISREFSLNIEHICEMLASNSYNEFKNYVYNKI